MKAHIKKGHYKYKKSHLARKTKNKVHKKGRKAGQSSGVSTIAIVNGKKTNALQKVRCPLPRRMFKSFTIIDEHQIIPGQIYSSFNVMLNSLTFPFKMDSGSSSTSYAIVGYNGSNIFSGLYTGTQEYTYHLPSYFQQLCNSNMYNQYKVHGVSYEITGSCSVNSDQYNLTVGVLPPGNTGGIATVSDMAIFEAMPTSSTYLVVPGAITSLKGYIDLRKVLGLSKLQADAIILNTGILNTAGMYPPSSIGSNESFSNYPVVWACPDKLAVTENLLLINGIVQTRPTHINELIQLQILLRTTDGAPISGGASGGEKIFIKLKYYVELFDLAVGQVSGPFNPIVEPDVNIP